MYVVRVVSTFASVRTCVYTCMSACVRVVSTFIVYNCQCIRPCTSERIVNMFTSVRVYECTSTCSKYVHKSTCICTCLSVHVFVLGVCTSLRVKMYV